MFAQCDQWQCSSEQAITYKTGEIISTIFINENKFGEKAKRVSQKTRTHSSVGFVVLYLLEGRIMHAEEFVLIPKRMFISKNPTKEEIFDNPMYQQKATQLALLQRTNPNFERNNEKKVQDADTNTDRSIKRTKSSDDATSDADDVRAESFFSDDSEIEPIVNKRRDSAFNSKMLELKIVDENKTKRAAIILNKIFNSNNISIIEETNILHINDEPQGVDVTSFLYNLQKPTKKIDLSKYSKILSELDISADLVYKTHAKKVVDQFYSEDEKETASRQPKRKTKNEQEGRRSEPTEKHAKPRVD